MKQLIYRLHVVLFMAGLVTNYTIAQSITATPTSLTGVDSFTATKFSGASAAQSVTFNWTNLQPNGSVFLFVPPPGVFQVSYIRLGYLGGYGGNEGYNIYYTVNTTSSEDDIAVRLRADLDVGVYTGTLNLVQDATGLNAQVNLRGIVTGLSTGSTTAITGLLTYINVPPPTQSYTLVGLGISNTVSVTATGGFEVSTSPTSGFSNSLSLAAVNGAITQVLYARLPGNTPGNKTGIITHSAGTFSTSISVSGQIVTPPTLVANAATASPAVVCAGGSVQLAVGYSGGIGPYTITWAGGGTIPNSSSASSTTVSSLPAGLQTYTATITDASGQTATAITSVINVISVVSGIITSFRAAGPTSCAAPTSLAATAPGMSFVITGPGGYVFSNVYRTYGIHPVLALGIKQKGQYTLTTYGPPDCPTFTSQLIVEGETCP